MVNKKNRMNKKGIEVSFDWIFAIVVGAIILVLAVYAVMRIVNTETTTSSTSAAKELGVILNPLEAGFADGTVNSIDFSANTELFFDCSNIGDFGKQKISTKTDTKLKGNEQGLNVSFANKYIFANKVVEGKKMVVFSKKFIMPFEVTNLLFLWSFDDRYCFVDPVNEVKDEIGSLIEQNKLINQTLSIVKDSNDCPAESLKVCFNSAGCNIDVDTRTKTVRKGFGKSLYYEGNLIYGAIFSDKDVYECQLKRLMKKTSWLAELYLEKSKLSENRGCGSVIQSDLTNYVSQTSALNETWGLVQISSMAETLKEENPQSEMCKLWKDS
jgi:hypothetical protein